jgi:hypothetical protein
MHRKAIFYMVNGENHFGKSPQSVMAEDCAETALSDDFDRMVVLSQVCNDGYGKQVPPSTKGLPPRQIQRRRGISSYRQGSVVMKSPAPLEKARPPFSKGEVLTRHSMLEAVVVPLNRTLNLTD